MPSAGADELIAFRDTARHREHQAEGQIGSGFSKDSGRMAHRDAGARSSREVDIVDSHREIADHSEMGQLPYGRGVKAVRDHAQHAVYPRQTDH